MRAIVIREQGAPDVLKLEDVPEPNAGPGQVLIRTEAVGVSYSEMSLRSGAYPMVAPMPTVFGFEAAGTVAATGEGADPALTGRRVVVMNTGFGSYAEYVAADADTVTEVPDAVSSRDAVAVANMGAVALCLLRAARLTASETVLVEAAAGGVGGYLMQLLRARHQGRVIATGGSRAKRDEALKLGAGAVLDHGDPAWPEKVRDALDGATLDVVFESIGGTAAGRLLDAMTPGTGRMLLYGMLSGPPAVAPLDLLTRNLTLTGCGGLTVWLSDVRKARADVLALAASGQLKPRVDSVLPLADAAEAHRRFEDRRAIGKIVLAP
jgi:NADPH:quinone reductase-like Zn-dependent oxidoreductase